MRKPISRVRSVTETSMMFITPMPPTTSAMSAMPVTSRVMVPVALSTVFLMVSVLKVKKSLLPCRAVSRRTIFCSASKGGTSSATLTVMEEMLCVPVTRYMTVVYGAQRLRVSEGPKPISFFFTTPATRRGRLLNSTTCPTASPWGKSFLRVLSSITTQEALARTSAASKNRPAASSSPLTSK